VIVVHRIYMVDEVEVMSAVAAAALAIAASSCFFLASRMSSNVLIKALLVVLLVIIGDVNATSPLSCLAVYSVWCSRNHMVSSLSWQ
jgi:hypothetical protein